MKAPTQSQLDKTTRAIELAEKLADRFERIGLDENGNMDKADKRLLDRLRTAINECRAEDPTCPACHGAKGRIRVCLVCKGTGQKLRL